MRGFDPSNISPGDIIDDFKIVEIVATGGSSTTFRATSRTLARDVALKFIHPVVFSGEDEAIEAARVDATRVARLEHPGIAPVFAAGLHEGGLYVASAMPKGSTLAELGAARSITPVDTARVLLDVAAALDAAHEQGVVHRDLRPESITVDRWGHGVVRDFGVTRTSGRTGLLTRAEILDSLRFTAPEIVLGRAAIPASDVYGLAAIAVWCLTGAPPYRDRPAAEYVVFRTSASPPVLYLADGTPVDEINAALASAMAVEPAARPEPARFAAALQEAVARLPAPAREAGSPLTASEAREAPPAPPPPAALPVFAEPAAAAGIPQPSAPTRAEHRRPVPPAPATIAEPAPWGTYAACAMVAVTVGLGGLLVGRAQAPAPAAPIQSGAFAVDTGDTWVAVGTGGPRAKFAGARLTGRPGETATVGVVADARLPGDPVPAELLPDAGMKPRPASSAGIPLVTYEAPGSIVVARPTSRGTIVAMCTGSRTPGRCASLVVNATGAGRALPVVAAEPVSQRLREAMTAIEQATGIASAEFEGDAPAQAGAAGRLASALREAASGLQIEGVDRGTAGELERLRAALTEQAGALEELGGAIDRESDVAFDAASDLARAGRRKLRQSLAAFERAGYPVQR